jgi:hypothetical protein
LFGHRRIVELGGTNNEAKQRCQSAAPQVVMMQTIPAQQQMQVVGQV